MLFCLSREYTVDFAVFVVAPMVAGTCVPVSALPYGYIATSISHAFHSRIRA